LFHNSKCTQKVKQFLERITAISVSDQRDILTGVLIERPYNVMCNVVNIILGNADAGVIGIFLFNIPKINIVIGFIRIFLRCPPI
jgi:hypothetical protein